MARWWMALALVACTAEESPVGVNEIGAGWLEVYSADGATSFDGWTLAPDGEASWTVPSGTNLDDDGLLVIYFAGETGPIVADFTIPAEGTLLVVRDAVGDLMQEITVPALSDEESFGRIPDGVANWQVIGDPTPGTLNAP